MNYKVGKCGSAKKGMIENAQLEVVTAEKVEFSCGKMQE